MKFKLIEKIIILLMLISNIVYFLFTGSIDIKLLLVSMTGIVSVVLAAKGHVYTYYLGIIHVLIYAYIAFNATFYATTILGVMYYLPMQFVGIYNWRKHLSKKDGIVKVEELTSRNRILIFIGLIFVVIIVGNVLKYFGDVSPFIDAFTTTVTLVATYLCVKRFKEHWFLWMFVNLANTALWTTGFIKGVEDSSFMIVMCTLFFINSIYGFINWNKMNNKK